MHEDPTRFRSVVAPGIGDRAAERRRGVVTLLTTIVAHAAVGRDPRAARERLEEELRIALGARAVVLRDTSMTPIPPASNIVSVEVPVWTGEGRARLDAIFDGPRTPDEWIGQQMEAAAQVAGLLLQVERANSRAGPIGRRQADGAAPLIGSSDAIRRVRDRIERVAATDFTVLIEGASGPEPHPDFIDVFV
jgi:DNA-binding NtrC family response regulator